MTTVSSLPKDFNLLELALRGMQENLSELIFEEVMDDLVEKFKEQAGPIVMEAAQKITFKGIERIQDMTTLRDEILLRFMLNDEELANQVLGSRHGMPGV